MDISVFEVIGPVMIGPSSSHTAGAARLSRVARQIVGESFTHVSFGLHGSFAKTYKGHGTDKALVAGAIGLLEDDERLSDSFSIAEKLGITYDFYEIELNNVHENSVKFRFFMKDGSISEIIGSSIGGGQIIIRNINGFETEFTAQLSTLIISQYDKKGVISEISKVLAENDINIGIMKVSREAKGEKASCIIETDGDIPLSVVKRLTEIKDIIDVRAINLYETV